MAVLKTEVEWRLVGRYVKGFEVPLSLNDECQGLYAEEQTFLAGQHPYHVPNFVGGEDDSLTWDNS